MAREDVSMKKDLLIFAVLAGLILCAWLFSPSAAAVLGAEGGDATPHTAYRIVEWSAVLIEIAGIVVIIGGMILSTIVILRRRAQGETGLYHRYRSDLGRAILLGLEFLVAADIIGTVALTPNFKNIGVLGLIVVVRTFLSFTLELEVTGRWPWDQDTSEQRRKA
jgi:uncharacterized membrane protein